MAAPAEGALEATVEHVAAGPGRWEIVLATGQAIRAHLPLSEQPPAAGERRALSLDPELATLVG